MQNLSKQDICYLTKNTLYNSGLFLLKEGGNSKNYDMLQTGSELIIEANNIDCSGKRRHTRK